MESNQSTNHAGVEYSIRDNDEAIVLDLQGQLNILNAPALQDVLEQIMMTPSTRLVLNMKEITHIDSSGLGTLIKIKQKYRENNCVMVMGPCPNDTVYQIFKVANLVLFF